jgi:hypothetical protein
MSHDSKEKPFDWLGLWILFATWASLSGWALSWLGCLDMAGEVVSLALFICGLIYFRPLLRGEGRLPARRLFQSRYVVPRIWLLLAVLAIIGGILYAPNNYDYLTYRFTRVLNWCWDHGWTWIPTENQRINYSGTGFEWIIVPLLILSHSDRLFFLVNAVSYLFLPGLIFSVFTRLGISKRISWWWMWVFPCGACFILQAGSVGNDSFAAVYFLAALHYLFQARTSAPLKNLTFSCLAIALMTGTKASNLPLVLPWLTVLFFERVSFLEKCRFLPVAAVLIVAACISFLPVAALNILHTGSYTGDPANKEGLILTSPVAGVLGNSLQMAAGALSPPLLPGQIDFGSLLPVPLKEFISQGYPRFKLGMAEMQIEEGAGLGLGVTLFAAAFVLLALMKRPARQRSRRSALAMAVLGAGVISWLGYLSKMGSESTARLMAPYYPIAIAGLLMALSLDGSVVRRRACQWCGILALLSALPLVILCPSRPLFPWQVVGHLLESNHAGPGLIARYNSVYAVYATRSDAFAEIRALIPADERNVALLQIGDDPEAALWRPFGARRVTDVQPEDSADEMRAAQIHLVVVSEHALAERYHTTIEALSARWYASVIAEKSIAISAHRGPETWYLLRL